MTIVELESVASFEEAFDRLDAAFDAAGQCVAFEFDPERLEAQALRALKIAERAKALAAERVAEADRCGVALINRVRSTPILLARSTRGPADELAPYKTIGLWMGAFPTISQAWSRGEITNAHVKKLRSLHNRRTDQFFRRDEQLLVADAKTLDWDGFLSACEYWLLHADPDGQLPSDRELAYGLKTKTHSNGDVEIHARLDPVTGEAALNAIEHEDQKLFRQTRDNPDAHPQLVAMSHRRRRLVALMNLISRGFERKDGSHPIPLINIVMSEAVAEDGNPSGSDEFGCAEHRPPVSKRAFRPPRAERRVERRPSGPTNGLRRQIFTVEGKTSNYSSGTRLFTAEQKNALLVEARGQCSTPGCDNGNPSGSNEFGCAEHRPPVSKRAFRPPGPKGE